MSFDDYLPAPTSAPGVQPKAQGKSVSFHRPIVQIDNRQCTNSANQEAAVALLEHAFGDARSKESEKVTVT
jgi:hypothetical protein